MLVAPILSPVAMDRMIFPALLLSALVSLSSLIKPVPEGHLKAPEHLFFVGELSAVESKCITQGRIKMHHVGRRFSRRISVVIARVKWLCAAKADVFSAGGC
jgi:hypothetical protein